MKKIKVLSMAVTLAAVCTLSVGCIEKAPDKIELKVSELMLAGTGEAYDISKEVITEGGSDSPKLKYKVSDESIAVVDDNGVITAKGQGTVVVTVASSVDEGIAAAADVLVYPYHNTYSAVKYIEAMGCNIRIRLALNPDGSYDYYRYPMNVALSGGGQMPSLSDKGSYKTSGGKFTFTGDILGEFTMDFKIEDKTAYLEGDMPTGGATTHMKLMINSKESKGENGTYTASTETEDCSAALLTLTLNDGKYTLKNSDKKVSEGSYTFENNRIEFSAKYGVSFGADYNKGKGTVEGTLIPINAEAEEKNVSATLTKQ